MNADQAREALTAIEGARQRESFAFDPAAARAARNGARFGSASGPCVALRDYVALERPPLNPYLATRDGRTVLLAAETALLFAGPSGLGKSLAAAFDLAGRLAAEHPSDWLGFRVRAGLRVLLLSFEGSDEDTAEGRLDRPRRRAGSLPRLGSLARRAASARGRRRPRAPRRRGPPPRGRRARDRHRLRVLRRRP